MKFEEMSQKIVMRRHFVERTNRHIDLVKKWAGKIVEKRPDLSELSELLEKVESHDASKFHDPEIEPYVLISWSYKMKDEGKDFKIDDETKKKLNVATEHHITNNDHHVEFFCGKKDGILNTKDRDEVPDEMIDGSKMPPLCIAEMCADWMAVGEERGNTARERANKNVNKRWKFTDDQVKLIYDLISLQDLEEE
jgi:hypothetical protein